MENLVLKQKQIDLLLKRMSIVGLPPDLIGLVSVWLKDRSFYVTNYYSFNGCCVLWNNNFFEIEID